MQNKLLTFLLFLSTIPLANYFISNIGTVCLDNGPCLIPVGFGLMAPSGVLFIGLSLVLRDWLYEVAGKTWVFAGILIGAMLSLLTSDPFVAIASASAFTLAELLDTAVYTKIRKAGVALAIVASGIIGAVVDSVAFNYLAFASLEFSAGNALAKIYASVLVGLGYYVWSNRDTLSWNTDKQA